MLSWLVADGRLVGFRVAAHVPVQDAWQVKALDECVQLSCILCCH